MDFFLWVGSKLLPQMKEFKYHRILFTSEGKMEHEMDRPIGVAAAVMQTIVMKRELSLKAKLLIYQLIYVPTLPYVPMAKSFG